VNLRRNDKQGRIPGPRFARPGMTQVNPGVLNIPFIPFIPFKSAVMF